MPGFEPLILWYFVMAAPAEIITTVFLCFSWMNCRIEMIELKCPGQYRLSSTHQSQHNSLSASMCQLLFRALGLH